MAVTLLPDIEQLLSAFLRDQAEVTALVGQRVYTALPTSTTFPAVRLTRFGGAPVRQRPVHLDAADIQLDAFGGPKATALEIAETCRAVIWHRLPGEHAEGIVTGVDLGALAYSPDDTYTPAKPRYLFTATVYAHPWPADVLS